MLNLRYFLDPRFGVAAGVITLVFFAMFGFFFLLTQYFQLVGLRHARSRRQATSVRDGDDDRCSELAEDRSSPRRQRRRRHRPDRCLSRHVPVHDRSRRYAVLAVGAGGHGHGRRNGDVHSDDDRLDHVGSPDGQGRCRLGDERHDSQLVVHLCRSARQSRRIALRHQAGAALDLLPESLHGQASESLAGDCTQAAKSVVRPASSCEHRREAFLSGVHLAQSSPDVSLLAAASCTASSSGNPHAHGAATRQGNLLSCSPTSDRSHDVTSRLDRTNRLPTTATAA